MINLKDFGLKSTKSREKILRIIESSDEPLTAEQIYKLLNDNDINLSTVYRTLTSFSEESIIHKEIDNNGIALYMIIKQEHRHVLVCIKCGKHIYLKNCPYELANQKILEENNFLVENHNIEIYGLCENCQRKRVLDI